MIRPRSLSLTLVLLALASGCSKSAPPPAQNAAKEQAPQREEARDAASADVDAASADAEAAGGAAPEEPAKAAEVTRAADEAPGAKPTSPSRTLADDTAIAGSRVEIAEPMINGGLNRDIIRRKAMDHEDDIRACHAKSLVDNPELFGTVALKLKVDARGVVKDVELGDASELDERVLVDCLLELVSGWSFTDATGKADVELRFDLNPPE